MSIFGKRKSFSELSPEEKASLSESERKKYIKDVQSQRAKAEAAKLAEQMKKQELAFLENPDKNPLPEKTKNTAGAGNQAAGMLVSQAGGGSPITDAVGAGIMTGNPLVGVGLGVLGGLQGAAKEKQRKRDIDSQALMQQSQNEQSTQMRRSAAIQSLAANLSRSLLS